jgi:hypothetical protein
MPVCDVQTLGRRQSSLRKASRRTSGRCVMGMALHADCRQPPVRLTSYLAFVSVYPNLRLRQWACRCGICRCSSSQGQNFFKQVSRFRVETQARINQWLLSIQCYQYHGSSCTLPTCNHKQRPAKSFIKPELPSWPSLLSLCPSVCPGAQPPLGYQPSTPDQHEPATGTTSRANKQLFGGQR